jgi:3',5'-cyclic AMP phosphodiesterase CpdA
MAVPSRSALSQVLVLSDSHVSARTPEAVANWAAVAALAGEVELVIHAGDLTLDGARDEADVDHARRLLDALPSPWFAIPGNHDVGDNPGCSEGLEVDQARLDRWRSMIGPDYWTIDVGEWTLVGINALLFNSGLEAEAEQWDWLHGCLARQPPRRPVALFSHKPLTASDAELAATPPYRFLPAPARDSIIAMIDRVNCPLVISGHVHQYRVLDNGDRRHAWAPTTWAVLPEWIQETVGAKRCGALSLQLGEDGAVNVELVEPPGLAQLTLGVDLPDPYDS